MVAISNTAVNSILNTGVIYRGVLTLEYIGTVVNYLGMFITLAWAEFSALEVTHAEPLPFYGVKLPNFKLKTRPKQLIGSFLFNNAPLPSPVMQTKER